MATPSGRATGRLAQALPLLGLIAAIWALLPPYSGPDLATEMRVEIADHVVPSILLVALSLASLIRARRLGSPLGSGTFMLLAGLGILLAGFWMVATHLPLVAQARRGDVPGGTAAYHTAPGLAVMVLGLVWTVLHWNDAAPESQRPARPGSPGG
ncbi:MAG TPA: hypothetical protein VMZ51_02910 [Acidimicrobiales bacterium]|nr:hypothetical protein [Acidimicrobiales bacterium]